MTPSATFARRALVVAPRWFRPAALVLVAGLHAGALYALGAYRASGPPALKSVELTLVAAGDEAPATTPAASALSPAPREPGPTAEADIAPPPDPRPAVERTPEPAASPELAPPSSNSAEAAPPRGPAPIPPTTAEPPPIVAAPADESTPAPSKPPVPKPDQTSLAPSKPKPPRPRPVNVAKLEAPMATRPSEAHQVGSAEGAAHDAGLSREAYGAMLLAAIQAHKYYPEDARARGVVGSVGVAFSVGATGAMSAVSIVRSSGSPELDEAVRKIVRSVSAPPPPGGSFSASTTIVFRID